MQRATDERFDFGNMEGGMDTAQGTREVETDCGGTDDLGDGEGSDEAGSELAGLSFERKVFGGEPHALSLAIWGRLRATSVGLNLHPS